MPFNENVSEARLMYRLEILQFSGVRQVAVDPVVVYGTDQRTFARQFVTAVSLWFREPSDIN